MCYECRMRAAGKANVDGVKKSHLVLQPEGMRKGREGERQTDETTDEQTVVCHDRRQVVVNGGGW